ncbi:uncharacterized protein Dvar_59640 [Desulfosarcina variabilis str. Montpellier]|uniref:hypothetical protein n=1 Tax=Desulfosarcina variabilis TaxID=2300 RepID=UPI003AFB2EF1
MSHNIPPARDRRLRTVAGHDIYFDWDDFLWNPHDWNEAIALALAAELVCLLAWLNRSIFPSYRGYPVTSILY